jgi:short-subunit dehydrogenase
LKQAPPSLAEVQQIVSIGDPAIRNLRITQCYHELSSALTQWTGMTANWCTFATWASKQAGQTIRKEDLARLFESHFREAQAREAKSDVSFTGEARDFQAERVQDMAPDMQNYASAITRASDAAGPAALHCRIVSLLSRRTRPVHTAIQSRAGGDPQGRQGASWEAVIAQPESLANRTAGGLITNITNMEARRMAENPVVIITGASSGIGEAAARLFAQEGYRVALGARRVDRLVALAKEIESKGGQALPIGTDCSRLMDIENFVSATLDRFGQIDVLLNNAGFGRVGWLEKLDPVKDVEEQIGVNLIGAIQMAQAVLPHMIARRSGTIVNMASMAAYIATPTYSVYAASKFALRGFTEALRREVSAFGIHVVAIYPGGVKTEFSQHIGARRKTGITTPEVLRLNAEQVAGAVLNAVRKPRRGIILPWPMRLAAWGNSLFPGLVDWIIERNFTQKEREK